MAEESKTPLHKLYAEGKMTDEMAGSNFGVAPHNHRDKPHNEPKHGRKKHMHDGKRAIPTMTEGYHPEVDHGPFHEANG